LHARISNGFVPDGSAALSPAYEVHRLYKSAALRLDGKLLCARVVRADLSESAILPKDDLIIIRTKSGEGSACANLVAV